MLLFTDNIAAVLSANYDEEEALRALNPFAATDDDSVVDYEGASIPARLLHWFKSPTKRVAIESLYGKSTVAGAIRSVLIFRRDKKSGGVYFSIFRSDKRRGYYSHIYRTLIDAARDVKILLTSLSGLGDVQCGELLRAAHDEFHNKEER